MSEELQISISTDARDLFNEHDIETVRKIRATASQEMEKKQRLLQNFIGDNYRPLLDTTPVLEEIQKIIKKSQNDIVSKFPTNIWENNQSKKKRKPLPITESTQLYLSSIKSLDKHLFCESLSHAKAAIYIFHNLNDPSLNESLNDNNNFNNDNNLRNDNINNVNSKLFGSYSQKSSDPIISSLQFSVNCLPKRIFNGITCFLCSPNEPLTSENLQDCSSALMSPELKQFCQNPEKHLDESLQNRVKSLIQNSDSIINACHSFAQIIEAFPSIDKSNPIGYKTIASNLTTVFSSFFDLSSKPINPKLFPNDLREVLKASKTIEELSKVHFSSKSITSYQYSFDLWKKPFLFVFQNLAKYAVSATLNSLNLPSAIDYLLNRTDIESYSAFNDLFTTIPFSKIAENSSFSSTLSTQNCFSWQKHSNSILNSSNVVSNQSLKQNSNKIQISEASLFDQNITSLKQKSMGIKTPLIQFREGLDNCILSLSSQIQSTRTQATPIAEKQFLIGPMIQIFEEIKNKLNKAINHSPLTVCLLTQMILSPSVCQLLTDNNEEQLNEMKQVIENASNAWAAGVAIKSRSKLTKSRNSGFSYLFYLEKEILDSGGHVFCQPLAKSLRKAVVPTIIQFYQNELKEMKLQGDIATVKAIEASTANLFKEFCLIERILGINNCGNLRAEFIKRMDVVSFGETEKNIQKEIDLRITQSGELIRLIGDLNFSYETQNDKLQPSSNNYVQTHLEELFS